MQTPLEAWTAGEAYERYIGRWSRPAAQRFVDWLEAPSGGRWLDVGCGAGALTAALLERASPSVVVGLDPSRAFLDFARERIPDARAAFRIGDAQALPFGDAEFDAVVSGLVLNFVPRPEVAVAEMRRVVRPGGVVAVYLWDYAGEMQLIRRFWDAACELDPGAAALDEGRRFPICQPAALRTLFEAAGLRQVETRAIDAPTPFLDFDDYWTPFLGGQGPAPTYACALPEASRAALRDRLRDRLPTDAAGRISLTARAFAVRGRPA
jgi:SAM-dependent methyltransferase